MNSHQMSRGENEAGTNTACLLWVGQPAGRFMHADNIDLFLIAFIFLGIVSIGNHSNVVN